MLKYVVTFLFLTSYASFSVGQYSDQPSSMEEMINSYLDSYPLSDNNKFKIAAYAELKGYYSSRARALRMEFGNIASLTFYERNCLLKINQQFFYLNLYDEHEPKIIAFNEKLDEIFEYINLMGNYGASEEHIAFVNHWLARKGIEPFDKVFTRHILLKYGKYNPDIGKVVFHTDWLPDQTYAYRGAGDKSQVVKPASPLRMELDAVNLRGWYIKVGGYVYVEDVRHGVNYATGENYSYNLSAYKLFAQKLFVQSVQQVVEEETLRLKSDLEVRSVVTRNITRRPSNKAQVSQAQRRTSSRRSNRPSATKMPEITPLYHDKNWIPMMLNMLREKNVKITDPSVLQHLINKPYFADIYEHLSPIERKEVDKYDWRR